ncbi:MAG: hypothetical protein F6K40_35730 [Okeania sp. SIO3I5]|nr:hypothetical protein [Okeania sp. SIO3I5]NEQ41264.1 hypothetical protein [Okeania sp. SIO3I5]
MLTKIVVSDNLLFISSQLAANLHDFYLGNYRLDCGVLVGLHKYQKF